MSPFANDFVDTQPYPNCSSSQTPPRRRHLRLPLGSSTALGSFRLVRFVQKGDIDPSRRSWPPLRAPFALGDRGLLRGMLADVGARKAMIETVDITAHFPSLEAWVHSAGRVASAAAQCLLWGKADTTQTSRDGRDDRQRRVQQGRHFTFFTVASKLTSPRW